MMGSSYKSVAVLSVVAVMVGTALMTSILYYSGRQTFFYEIAKKDFIPTESFLTANENKLQFAPRQRYAVMSVGTEAKYSYWLPAVALTWKIRQGFTPILFLIQDDENSGWDQHAHSRLILDLLSEFGIQHVYFLKPDSTIAGNHDRMTQLSRLYASTLPFLNDHDYIITTDVDLLPVAVGDGQYYDSYDGNQTSTDFTPLAWQDRQRILLFDLAEFQATDNKWNYQFKEWALSNIGMTKLRWKQILHISSPIHEIAVPIAQSIVERVNEDVKTILLHAGDEWFWDQELVSLRLETAKRTGAIVWERDVLVKSRTNANRIDRIAWPASLSASEIDTKFDSHLPRVPDTRGTYHEIFEMTEWLLKHVLNRDGQGEQFTNRLKNFTLEFEIALKDPKD